MSTFKIVCGNAGPRDVLKVRATAALLKLELEFLEKTKEPIDNIFPRPILLLDQKQVSSATAICKLLCRSYDSGKVELLPSSLTDVIKVDEWIDWVSAQLEPQLDAFQSSNAIAELDSALNKGSPFLCGEAPTLADVFVWSALEAAKPNMTEKIEEYLAKLKAAIALKEKKEKKGKDKGIDVNPPSGTRDFYPDQMRFRSWLFGKWRRTASQFGFQEYDAPVLEAEELYKRKAGEEITQQMYNFVDKEGYRVTLRPEMTPSLARMVLGLTRGQTGDIAALLPLKWMSIPQCWRFETCQRGRKREHYQWNMDIIGVAGITADVELLACVVHFFESVGITSKDVGIKVNSRKVLGAVIEKAGVPAEQFAAVCVVIDKMDKIGAEAVQGELEKIGLPAETARKIINATNSKTLQEFVAAAGAEDSPEVQELQRLFDLCKDYGISEWINFDASVVRGLAYYTGVVFEGFDRSGELRAICGGGRYDRLLTLYGAKKEIPCCGFGFGDCVIEELLKIKGVLPELPYSVDYVVAAFNEEMVGPAMQVAAKLRAEGQVADLMQGVAKKVAKAFNYADRLGAKRIVFVAPDEWEKQLVRVKDLRISDEDAKQKDIPLDDLRNIDKYFGDN